MMFLSVLMQAAGGSSGWSTMVLMVLMIGIMYMFMIRPQTKKANEEKKFVESLQKGDKVVTIGGIHGKITDVQETTFTLEIDNNVRVKVERKAVSGEATKALNPAPAAEVAKK